MTPDENSNISRWIAFLVSPLVLLVAGFIALKAKQWFNVDVSSQDVAAYVFGIILSLGAILTTWLHNRGKHEIAKATGLSEDKVEALETLLEDRLPRAPDAPLTTGTGSPASPRAPGP
jgi:hypothetical protein